MFIETSAKAGYNVKQVICPLLSNLISPWPLPRSPLSSRYFFSLKWKQLFRRVAAALPGMEADKKPPEDSILFIFDNNLKKKKKNYASKFRKHAPCFPQLLAGFHPFWKLASKEREKPKLSFFLESCRLATRLLVYNVIYIFHYYYYYFLNSVFLL